MGRLLIEHMTATAARFGLREVRVVSHPPAEPFYRRLGAVRVGTVPPSPPGVTWERPELRFPIGDVQRTPGAARVTLLVLYTLRLEECLRFYGDLGLVFTAERHGRGPAHHAAVLGDGTVFELYPAGPDRRTDALRLGLAVDGVAARPPLAPGHHRRVDPDGRVVEIDALGPPRPGSP